MNRFLKILKRKKIMFYLKYKEKRRKKFIY
jgi:hypothetical protein